LFYKILIRSYLLKYNWTKMVTDKKNIKKK